MPRAMREAGVRRPRASTLANPSGLTTREAEVLKLLAQGLANAENAAAWYARKKPSIITLSSILAKLAMSPRTEAAPQQQNGFL